MGALLSPAVLDRLSPPAYAALFGGEENAEKMALIEQDIRQQVRTLRQSGAADEQSLAVAKAKSVRLRDAIFAPS